MSQRVRLTSQPPQSLSPAHRLEDFDCGEATLNEWLQRRALANHLSGASRTFVVVDEGGHVRGYYALAAGAVAHQDVSSAIRRNMPNPIPALLLARLAVDVRVRGLRLGAALLRDAVQRATTVAQHAGVRALVVHALNERAKEFYERHGLKASSKHPMLLFLPIRQTPSSAE